MANKPNLDALAKGRKAYQEKVAAGEAVRLNPHEKALANPNSLRCAVNGACYECVGGENWHFRVKYCQQRTCSLWSVRKNGKGVSIEECMSVEEKG